MMLGMDRKNQYLDFLEEWLSPLGEITKKYMFGGYCLYCDGVVFALVADNALFLKADAENRPAFEAIGAPPFQPFPDKPETMSYYPPPAEFFDNADVMLEWGRAAVEAGRRGGKKKKKSAKKTSGAN
jgi:DNA transformation protein and related proteins